MTFTEIKNEKLNESYFIGTHKSGLKIILIPRKGVSTYKAIFGTKCGSIDDNFRIEGESDYTDVPDGIAHFLEHKLFESEELGAFERYAKTGASANAGTGFDKTCYYFNCTDNFYPSLEILLDFVQSPYFTKETVDKEQGIIGQEIKMYEDDPEWRVFFNLLSSMYEANPVRKDIAGTVESISHITAELLYRCYNAFYNPANMALAVIGDFEIEELSEFIDKRIKTTEPKKISSRPVDEPEGVGRKYIEQRLPVSQPIFDLGYKENSPKTGRAAVRNTVLTNIILEMYFGAASDFYCKLYDEGLINSSFRAEYSTGRGFAFTEFAGESSNPEKVVTLIKKELEAAKNDGISEKLFSRAKKRLYGKAVSGFDSVNTVAWKAIYGELLNEGDMFTEIEELEKVTVDDVECRLKEYFDFNNSALSVILP